MNGKLDEALCRDVHVLASHLYSFQIYKSKGTILPPERSWQRTIISRVGQFW